MTQPALLVGPATLLTNSPAAPVLAGAGVLCSGDRIAEVGRWPALLAAHPETPRLDAGGKVVLPGLLNAHHHLYSTFARGMPIAPGAPLRTFPEILEGIWWRLDRALDLEAVEAGAWPPALDCLRWGTTAIVDHHASPSAIRGSLDALARVCAACGLRAALCYELTDRNGPEGARAGLDENIDFSRRPHGSRTRAMLGLHASFTLSDETLALAARSGPPSLQVHVHVAEDVADVERSLERFGARPLERLERAGLLRAGSLIAHGVHLGDEELRAVARAGAFLVHNPESNANNAVGALDVVRALELGVPVGLGTDGMASNMLRAAKSAYLVARHVRREPSAGIDLPRKLLLEGNARIGRELFGEPLFGTIAAGAPADLCVVDYEPPTPLEASTLDAHLTFGITECAVAATVAGGVVRFDRGAFPGLDAAAIAERVRAAAEVVWERLGRL
jgi:putative selenium metabolism protein SsnA